jgi:hypothetical protein
MDRYAEAERLGFKYLPFNTVLRLFTREWAEGQDEYSQHPFDRLFEGDYMGNSDFEFGALTKAYEAMVASDLVATSFEVEHDGVRRTVYLLAPRSITEKAQAYLPMWLEAGCPGVEAARFEAVFNEDYKAKGLPSYFDDRGELKAIHDTWELDNRTYVFFARERLLAWFDIQCGIAFTLNPIVANMLMQAFGVDPYK